MEQRWTVKKDLEPFEGFLRKQLCQHRHGMSCQLLAQQREMLTLTSLALEPERRPQTASSSWPTERSIARSEGDHILSLELQVDGRPVGRACENTPAQYQPANFTGLLVVAHKVNLVSESFLSEKNGRR